MREQQICEVCGVFRFKKGGFYGLEICFNSCDEFQ